MKPYPANSSRILFVILAGILALSGCDSITSYTAEEHIQRAKDFEAQGNVQGAVIELKNALQKAPANAESRLLLGHLYLELGDAVSAEKELNRARELGVTPAGIAVPLAKALLQQGRFQELLEKVRAETGLPAADRAELHLARGQARLGMADLLQAQAEFAAALNVQPDSPLSWHGQALFAYATGKWDEAAQWNERVLAAAPDLAEAQALKGDLGLVSNDFESASTAYEAAVRINPLYAPYRVGLAIAQTNTGKLREAEANLDMVLKDFPHDLTANYQRAVVAFRLHEYEAAKTYTEKVLNDADPTHLPSHLLAAATHYALWQLETANRHIQAFLARVPASVPATKLRAAIQLRMGKVEEAAQAVKGLSAQSEDDAQLLETLGVAALQFGNPSLGLELVERAVSARPEDAEARMRLGVARAAAGEYQTSIDELREALRLNPELHAADVLLGLSHLASGNTVLALDAARKVQRSQPGNPDGYTLAGLAYMLTAQNADARAAFGKALEIRAGDPNASTNLAVLHLRDGDAGEARRLFQEVLRHNPGHEQTLLRLANLEWSSGRPQQAIERLKEAAGRNPSNPGLQLALGELYLSQGDPITAIEVAEAALARFPGDPGLLHLLGLAQLQSGQPALAASSLEAVTRALPTSPAGHLHLALAHEQLGDLPRAKSELQRVLELAPDHGPARYVHARLTAKSGELDTAQGLLAELSSSYPGDPYVMELKGDLGLLQGRPEVAVDMYRAALSVNETNFLNARLAAAQLRSGDREAGLATLRTWLDSHPEDPYTRGALADALLAAGQMQEAGEHYRKILQRQPDNVAVINNLVWVSLETGSLGEALTYAERAHRLAPEQPQVLDTYAAVLLRKGDAAAAVDKLRTALAHAPGNTALRLHLAQAFVADGKAEQARRILQDLLALQEAFPQRAEAQDLLGRME